MYIFSFFLNIIVILLLICYKDTQKMDKKIEVEVEAASGRKYLGWKYAHLLNEKDTSTLI